MTYNEMVNVVEEAIMYLSKKTNTHYNPKSPSFQKMIIPLLANNFTLEDLKKVIDKKYLEWKGTDFEKYLRPETLFGMKFLTYLHEQPRIAKNQLVKLLLASEQAKQSFRGMDNLKRGE